VIKFIIGLVLAGSGAILYLIGVLTPTKTDPSLAPSEQPRGTFFFLGLIFVLGGMFLMSLHAFSERGKSQDE